MSQPTEGPSRAAVIQAIELNLIEHSLALGSGEGGETHDGPNLKWMYTGGPALNRVFGAQLDAGEVDEQIARVSSRYRHWGAPVIWIVGPSTQPVNLGGYLERHGWTRGHDWVGMAREMSSPVDTPALPPGLSIREVDDERSLRMWTRVGAQPVEPPTPAQDCFHRCFAHLSFDQPSRWRFFLGLLDDRPIARSMVDATAGAAGIYVLRL